ncbi:NACHT domain-containing protein [Chitinophaga filiformis]|uniref:NACHT domain-containing protein n=1 Tax=Chitinophaga filiformis TaxID=104663 RepID=A0A1G7IXW0_CHIFI|nr:hypothetical protein [Chitinophaga filiformis]SDF17455.1 hypothetical protein SAMN04488121_1011020 [Chitinophaga filiformis]
MIDLSYDFIITLQNEVSRKFGADTITPSDCKRLSDLIRDETTKAVSETTLKRVFGFATTKHSFSRYTLNTLAQYCNYRDWDDFQAQHYVQTDGNELNDSKWLDLKNKAVTISHYTITTLKNRSGVPFALTVPRPSCFAHIERFLESDYAATALIAPSGWGKSVTLVHMAEHFWFSKDAKFKKDICWFIHAHAAGSLLLRGFSLATWLDNQLNLGAGENFREYFAAHFDKLRGRLILIIDGFDEITIAGDKLKLLYTKLEEFVYSNDLFPWVKVILSIRSSTWSDIFQHSLQYPAFRRYWYLGPEMDEETSINLPSLTEQEVKSVLYNHRIDPATVRTFSEGFLQKLRYPYYLQLFCQLNTGPGQHFVNEHLSLFEMISKFVQTKVFNSPTNTFKVRIIEKMLWLLDLGKAGQHTDKNLLLNKSADLFPAYKELLADNILVEENLSQEVMFLVKVRFAHQFLLEYFSAMHYIKQANDLIDDHMLQKIAKQLPPSSYRVGVFKWLLRYAINNDQPEGIHKIFYLPLSTMEKSHLLEYLAVHYQHESEKPVVLNTIFPQGYFRRNPLSRFINDNFLHFGKKRVLNALLDLSEMPDDKLKIRSILFSMSLLQLDAEQCEQELSNIKKLISRETIDDEVWVSPYDLYLFIYEYLKFGIINESIKDKIYNYPRYLTGSTRHAPTVVQEIVFRMTGMAFALLNDNTHIFNYTKRIFECFPAMVYQRTNTLRLSLLCWQALAHLGLDNLPLANKICQHTDKLMKTYSFDFTSGRHIEVLQKMILAEVYFKEKELNRAIRTAEAAVEISQKMDFKLLLLTGFKLLGKMYSQVRFDKQYNQTQQQMTLINKSTSFKHFDKVLVAVTQTN